MVRGMCGFSWDFGVFAEKMRYLSVISAKEPYYRFIGKSLNSHMWENKFPRVGIRN